MGCIPPEPEAAFVCQREPVLEVDQRPSDPRRPVVGRDEPPKPLIAEARRPIPPAPGRPGRRDSESVREGVGTVWRFVEPWAGGRDVPVTATQTAVDWAQRVRPLVDHPRLAEAERITRVCDNWNTHTRASLDPAFAPAEALRRAQKREWVSTPKHGRWLNVAASAWSALTRQCLDRRSAIPAEVAAEAGHGNERRNARQVGVDGQFTTEDARSKRKHLDPKMNE